MKTTHWLNWTPGTLMASTLLVLLSTSAIPARAASSASVEDLAWMTGTWKGPMGEQVLEETWIRPAAGTIAAMIRITDGDRTEVVELILIEEAEDSLVFRVRQWLPGYVPRSSEPQLMELTEIGERRVRFEAPEPRELRSLTYTRPTETAFNIDVETAEGAQFQINLDAQ
jgi:hypothetical protein